MPIVIGVIPARYASTRFEGKVLAQIAGKPMIQWVYEQAKNAQLLDDLFVAVDDNRVAECVVSFGGKAIMTGSHHRSGTDRIAEVVKDIHADIVVNIQGDHPLIDPLMIDEAVKPMLENPHLNMVTIRTLLHESLYHDPGTVKVVVDESGFALYFSRSLIPYPRDAKPCDVYEHIGLYVYRKSFLLDITRSPEGILEGIEKLEQLRVLEKGHKILVVKTKCTDAAGHSVDTLEDLRNVEQYIKNRAIERR